MSEMNVEWLKPDELIPYSGNAKLHPPDQVEHIANSIKAFGWKQPIVVDKDNVVIIGHGRLMAAKKLMLDKVPVVFADDLSKEQADALRLADNKTNESEWDFGKLEEELAALDIAGFDMSDFGFEDMFNEEQKAENPEDGFYTDAINLPQYEPVGECPALHELVDTTKYVELRDKIMKADIDAELKNFLLHAASRHIGFNYKTIANFYAHQPKEIQELMEDSALVVIDINDAIRNGYAELSERLDEIEELDDEEE